MMGIGRKLKKWFGKPTVTRISLGEQPADKIREIKSGAWASPEAAGLYEQNVEHLFFDRVRVRYYLRYLQPTNRVLDMGAGTGRLSYHVADLGCEVTAVDVSRSMLDILERDRREGQKIAAVATQADQPLPFSDGTFDAVIQADFLGHMPTWKDILREEARVLRPGGVIIFDLYSGEALKKYDPDPQVGIKYLTNGDFYASCDQTELDELCATNGLNLVAIHPYGYLQENIGYARSLTIQESIQLRQLLTKASAYPEILETLGRFEDEIISGLPWEFVTRVVIVLKKTGNQSVSK